MVKNRGNIWIWYTDDARHMPVQIRARLFWGRDRLHSTYRAWKRSDPLRA